MKKNTRKKIIFRLSFVIFCFLLGMFIAFFGHNKTFYKIGKGFKQFPWWAALLTVIITIFINISVHEITHAIAFLLQKIKIRALYIFCFKFVRPENKKLFRIYIDPKLFLLGGGLVIPDIPPVRDDNEFETLIKKFRKSIIAAPIASIVFSILTIITWLLISIFTSNQIIIGLFNYFVITTYVVSFLVVATSKQETEEFSGDFKAYKNLKEDDLYKLIIINQYLIFNTNSYNQSKNYIMDKNENYLMNNSNYYYHFYQVLLTTYLENIIFGNGKRNIKIDEKLENIDIYLLSRTELGVELAYLIIYFNYINGNISLALKNKYILEKEALKSKIKQKKLIYLKKRANHLLNISNELEYINNEKNYYYGLSFILKKVINLFYDVKKNNIRLKPGNIKTDIKLYNII